MKNSRYDIIVVWPAENISTVGLIVIRTYLEILFGIDVTETFFKTLKTELVYDEHYRTREEARQSIFEYIEVFYNRQRKHSFLGYKSPVDFLLNKQQPVSMAS